MLCCRYLNPYAAQGVNAGNPAMATGSSAPQFGSLFGHIPAASGTATPAPGPPRNTGEIVEIDD